MPLLCFLFAWYVSFWVSPAPCSSSKLHLQVTASGVARQGDLHRARCGGSPANRFAVPSRMVSSPVGKVHEHGGLGGGAPEQFELGVQRGVVGLESAAVDPGVETRGESARTVIG